MNKDLFGMKVAMLVANGFEEEQLVRMQKTLSEEAASIRIVSTENGLACGWTGDGWGHHFAVDCVLANALGADYNALVIPGGQRSQDKLNLTAHTKRFINSFIESGKPVIVIGDALHLLILTDNIKGRVVSGPENMKDVVLQAGGTWADEQISFDQTVMSVDFTSINEEQFNTDVIRHLSQFRPSIAA
jgi:protease I